jgi:hypothetical protein
MDLRMEMKKILTSIEIYMGSGPRRQHWSGSISFAGIGQSSIDRDSHRFEGDRPDDDFALKN